MHLVTKARQTVEQYRVLNMFRRESSEPAPSGGIHVPARVHCHLLADPQAVRYDHSVNPSVACGRIRHRRLHRQCNQYSPSQKLTCGSMNVQGFCWSHLQHRPKFTAILSMLRRRHLDVLFLSDIHESPVIHTKLQVTYVDEFCFIFSGAVAIVLRKALALCWEAGGRQFSSLESTDRLLAIQMHIHETSLALVANYTPAAAKVGDRRQHYSHARSLHAKLSQYDLQLWGGDFNGHIAANSPEPNCVVGPYGLGSTDTTMGGRVLQEFLRTTDLAHVDSHRRCRNRGTWRHPHTHTWYEIDAFLILSKSLHLVNPGLHCYPGVADHWAKEISLHLGNPDKRQRRLQRIFFLETCQIFFQWQSSQVAGAETPGSFRAGPRVSTSLFADS